jgi:hypothetical protein
MSRSLAWKKRLVIAMAAVMPTSIAINSAK